MLQKAKIKLGLVVPLWSSNLLKSKVAYDFATKKPKAILTYLLGDLNFVDVKVEWKKRVRMSPH